MKVVKDIEFDLETICVDDHEGLFIIFLTWWQASLQTWWWGRWWRGNLPQSGSPYLISTETPLMGLLFQSPFLLSLIVMANHSMLPTTAAFLCSFLA